MKNLYLAKIKKFSAFTCIVGILVCVSYLLVYKASFLPNGFDIESIQKDKISLKSLNLFGTEKEMITVTFSENDSWKINEIESEVNRQKEFLWMLYSAVSVSIFLLFYKIRNGAKVWKAIWESNIIFAFLFMLFPVTNSLKRIMYLIS